MNPDFYEDLRWCERCDARVRYLLSPRGAWCVRCGERVRIFDPIERAAFLEAVRRSHHREGRESA